MMPETSLTMVSEENAEVGKAFVFMGEQIECTDCKFKKICLDLKKGGRYMIIAVRPPVHECVLTGGNARVVEVVKTERTVCVDKKYAIDGSMITFFPSECQQTGCRYYRECNPEGISSEEKVKVSVVEGKINCPIGRTKNIVTIE